MLQNGTNHNISLAIITVVYQNYSILKSYLESLSKQTNNNFQIFIADLSLNKDSSIYDKFSNLPITVITGHNAGYAHGVNLGLKKAISLGFQKFCITNNDIFVDKNFTESALNAITHYPASIIGGKIYYAPGFEFHKNRYLNKDLGKIIWYAGGKVDWDHALTPHLGVDQVDNGEFDKIEETSFVNGCLMCFDKSVIDKVGFWDESYFLYFEDSDYCERAKRKNIKLFYIPSIRIWHKNAQSTGGSGSKIHQFYQKKSRLIFSLKYAPFKTKLHVLKNYFFE